MDAGCESSAHDEYFYGYQGSNNGIIAVLTTFVDDLLVSGNDEEEIRRIVKNLSRGFRGEIWVYRTRA